MKYRKNPVFSSNIIYGIITLTQVTLTNLVSAVDFYKEEIPDGKICNSAAIVPVFITVNNTRGFHQESFAVLFCYRR